MKNFLSGGLIAASFALASTAPAQAESRNDPESDADCTISLMLLMGQDDVETDAQDAIFGIATYYFGRLGGEGKGNVEYLISRMDRFVEDEMFYLEKSQECATDFEADVQILGKFGETLTQ